MLWQWTGSGVKVGSKRTIANLVNLMVRWHTAPGHMVIDQPHSLRCKC